MRRLLKGQREYIAVFKDNIYKAEVSRKWIICPEGEPESFKNPSPLEWEGSWGRERALPELVPLSSLMSSLPRSAPGNLFWKQNFEPDVPFMEGRGAKTRRAIWRPGLPALVSQSIFCGPLGFVSLQGKRKSFLGWWLL